MNSLYRTSKVKIIFLITVFLFSCFAFANTENTKNYKLISTVECKGDGVYNSRYEVRYKVDKVPLGNNTFRYKITAENIGKEMSFNLDRDTMRMSGSDQNFQFQERVNNICVQSLKKDTLNNINKTWKQSFDLSPLGKLYPSDLKFTLTSQNIYTKKSGEMVVVRALSEPFMCEGTDKMKCRTNSVYVFDSKIENLYMSASVVTVEATSAGQGKSILCHQIATLQTDSLGKTIDLGFSDNPKVAKKYAEFVRKVGLREKVLETKDKKLMNLPLWAKSDALKISQSSNLCAGYACEQGVNPVSPIIVMSNHAIAMQSAGYAGAVGYVSVGETLAASLGTPSVSSAAFMGVGAGTAALAGGGAAAAAGGFSGGGGGSSSAASP